MPKFKPQVQEQGDSIQYWQQQAQRKERLRPFAEQHVLTTTRIFEILNAQKKVTALPATTHTKQAEDGKGTGTGTGFGEIAA